VSIIPRREELRMKKKPESHYYSSVDQANAAYTVLGWIVVCLILIVLAVIVLGVRYAVGHWS
jgi:uncharacterized membrane protein